MNKIARYGYQVNTHDLIKFLAIALMIIDHVGKFYYPENLTLRLLGRGAAPLFFFLIGYQGKLHLGWEIITFGVVLTLSGSYLYHFAYINILINFILVYGLLRYIHGLKQSQSLFLLIFSACTFLNFFLYVKIEYGLLGFLIALSAYLLNKGWPYSPYYLLYSLMLYFLWESIQFGFLNTPATRMGIAIMPALWFLIMLHYRLYAFNFAGWIKWPILLLSRYSLEIYFMHLLLFQILAVIF